MYRGQHMKCGTSTPHTAILCQLPYTPPPEAPRPPSRCLDKTSQPTMIRSEEMMPPPNPAR